MLFEDRLEFGFEARESELVEELDRGVAHDGEDSEVDVVTS